MNTILRIFYTFVFGLEQSFPRHTKKEEALCLSRIWKPEKLSNSV